MAEIIDQSKTFTLIKARIAQTTNPRHRAMLERLLAHAEGEAVPDVEAVMATLAPHPVYRAWGSGPEMNPEGTEAVRSFYLDEVVAKGKHFLEFDLDRIVVDDATIVTEGFYKSVYWGRDAQAAGLPADDPEAFYLLQLRMLIVWPFDADGFILGEESYSAFTRPDFLQKIEKSQLPAAFRSYIQSRRAAAA